MHGRPSDDTKFRQPVYDPFGTRSPPAAIAPVIQGGRGGYDAYHSYCVMGQTPKPSSGLKIHTYSTPSARITPIAAPVSPLPSIPTVQQGDLTTRVALLEKTLSDLMSSFDQRVQDAVNRELANRGIQSSVGVASFVSPLATVQSESMYSDSSYVSSLIPAAISFPSPLPMPASAFPGTPLVRARSTSPTKRAPPPPPESKIPMTPSASPKFDQLNYASQSPPDEENAYKVPMVHTPLPRQPTRYLEKSNYSEQGSYHISSEQALSPSNPSLEQDVGSYHANDPYHSDTIVEQPLLNRPIVSLPVLAASESLMAETTRLQIALAECLPAQEPTDASDESSRWRVEFFKARAQRVPEAREKALSTYCNQFLEAAKTAALVIFSEMDRPSHERTIQPVSVGGVAGGTKYIHKGIFFKLVADVEIDRGRWLYGEKGPSLELANKAAGNDLRGANFYLNNFLALGLPVAVPLQVLLDYHGYRLIAMPILPLTKTTLVYGSDDAGVNVHNSHPPMNIAMRLAALHMHLKAHVVRDTELHAAGDVEGHVGTDGRMYLLDLARTTPPEASSVCTHLRASSAAVFYRVFRPEFLLHLRDLHTASNRTQFGPLNPDSLTKWGKDSHPIDHVDVQGAAEILLARIRALVRELETQPELPRIISSRRSSISSPSAVSLVPSIVVAFHQRGISLRHLGYARSISTSFSVRHVLLIEMVRRSLKNMLRHRMREMSRLGNCVNAVSHMMSCVTDELHPEHKGMWEIKLPGDITSRFGTCALLPGESIKSVFANSLEFVTRYVYTSLGIVPETMEFNVVWKSMFVAERACLQTLLLSASHAQAGSLYPVLADLQPRFLRGTDTPDDLLRGVDAWEDRTTVLVWAIAHGHYYLLECMLEAKVSPDTKDHYGDPALASAAFHASLPAIRMLLRYGADVKSSTPLVDAALSSGPDANECMEVLFEAKADPNLRDQFTGQTVLHYAAQDGMLGAVNVLLRHGLDPNDRNQDDNAGDTVLMAAAKNGHTDVVKRLLEVKADARARNHVGEGVLHWAADDLVDMLKEAGADEDGRSGMWR